MSWHVETWTDRLSVEALFISRKVSHLVEDWVRELVIGWYRRQTFERKSKNVKRFRPFFVHLLLANVTLCRMHCKVYMLRTLNKSFVWFAGLVFFTNRVVNSCVVKTANITLCAVYLYGDRCVLFVGSQVHNSGMMSCYRPVALPALLTLFFCLSQHCCVLKFSQFFFINYSITLNKIMRWNIIVF